MRGSPRCGTRDDFFLVATAWGTRRQDCFRTAGWPLGPSEAATWLTPRLNAASERFRAALPAPPAVPIDMEGWPRAPAPAEALSPADAPGLAALRAGLCDKSPPIRLPALLIAVDHALDWPRHCLPRGRRATRTAAEVCQVGAPSRAYGCQRGPEPRAPLPARVSDEAIQRSTDW